MIIFNADTPLGDHLVRETLDTETSQKIMREYEHVFASVRSIPHSGDLTLLGACLLEMGDEPEEKQLCEYLTKMQIKTCVLVPNLGSEKLSIQAKKIISACAQAKVERFVLVSMVGADDTSVATSRHFAELESTLKQSGIGMLAIVRVCPFQQILFQYRRQLREGALRWPVEPDAKFSSVNVFDVSNFITHELLHGGERRTSSEPRMFKLTGPNVYTPNELCKFLSKVSGREIKYQKISRSEFEKYLRDEVSLPQIMVKELADWKELINRGKLNFTSDDEKKSTGKEPIKLNDWLNKHKHLFEVKK